MNASALLLPLAGGVLIGLSSGLLLLLSGKIAGISGILDGAVSLRVGRWSWRAAFLAGLIAGGAAVAFIAPQRFPTSLPQPPPYWIGAGLLVGVGSRLGSGCTSGHGVCGLGRFSVRSLVSVCTFVTVAAVTVYVTRHMIGGAP
ncbi:MAG TPA: YeeE/YedE thiosulfate transporter family protein [bacterium]